MSHDPRTESLRPGGERAPARIEFLRAFLLGHREIADGSVQVFSEQSPLGAAILGKKVGDGATYAAPNGTKISVKIAAAKPYTG